MIKILAIILAIYLFFRLAGRFAKKIFANFLMKNMRNMSGNSPFDSDLKKDDENILYEKDDVVIMKGEADNLKKDDENTKSKNQQI
jgi:hypothetical protein